MATEAEILAARRDRARRLAEREALFPARVPRRLDRIPELRSAHDAKDAAALEREAPSARVAGRIMSLRSFGKATFAMLQSEGARLQVWVKLDAVGAARFEVFRLYETGDFMWAEGPLVRTKSGELTVDARELGFLAKAYRPLPEKWHGLRDVEARYRERHVDLLVNEEVRRIALCASRTVSAVRAFLDERGFLEVETPILQAQYGGAHARPFATHHNTYQRSLYLRISLELYLKRLVVAGFDRVYEIGRNFRNEGISRKHSPEFSMLEVYQAYADYHDMMDLTERLVACAAERVLGTTKVERDGRTLELAPPWPRRPLAELVRERTGIDLVEASSLAALRAELRRRPVEGVDPGSAPSWARLVDDLFSAAVEPTLIDPIFVVDYPVELSPLAKRKDSEPRLVERFEPFVGGFEIGNAFSELNDPDDQRARFLEQVDAGEAGDEEAHPLDEDFLRALEQGMPPTGGLGIGMGRLVMILSGAQTLREVTLFPQLRPREGEGGAD
jgi:lysyl-tRNA synthetase class 2